jgi:hypothetical protein
VDPVPDPLLLRKSGSARNRTRDLWICSQELWRPSVIATSFSIIKTKCKPKSNAYKYIYLSPMRCKSITEFLKSRFIASYICNAFLQSTVHLLSPRCYKVAIMFPFLFSICIANLVWFEVLPLVIGGNLTDGYGRYGITLLPSSGQKSKAKRDSDIGKEDQRRIIF